MTPLRVALLTALLFAPASLLADHAININTADKDALMTLNGIGEVKAEAIIEYREQNGPYATKEDIQNVSGIGDVTYANIKDHIVVSGTTSPAPSPPPEGSPPPPPSPASSSSPSPNPSPSSQKVAPPDATIYADAGNDMIVAAGADVEFRGRAYNKQKQLLDRALYEWNFGDGSSIRGENAQHTYAYPGRYAVLLTVREGKAEASDRITVTVEAAALAFTSHPDGSVAIENLGKNDVDVSHWIVHSAEKNFFLPAASIILKGELMRISEKTLGFPGSGTALWFPNGTPVPVQTAPPEAISMPTSTPAPVVPPATEIHDAQESHIVPTAPEVVEEDEGTRLEEAGAESQVAAVAAGENGGSYSWWAGALSLALVGTGAVYVARRYKRNEWDIIDET